jgi:hypothetical protein
MEDLEKTEDTLTEEDVYGMSDEDLQNAVEGNVEPDRATPGEGETEEGEETSEETSETEETGETQTQEGEEGETSEQQHVSYEEYQKVLKERDDMAQAWNAFDKDPVGFVRQFPQLAQRMGIDTSGQNSQGGQQAAIPNVPQAYQGHEAQKRAAEDAELAQLKETDLVEYEDRLTEVRLLRQQRQEFYDLKNIEEQGQHAQSIEQKCQEIFDSFVGEYGQTEQNKDGLSMAEVEKVVDFAIANGLVHNLKAAYLVMNESGLMKKAQIQGAKKVTDNLQKHTSTTRAGKGAGEQEAGTRELTEADLENMDDEAILKMGKDLGWS